MIAELNGLLKNYEIMPDSFVMPSDYSKGEIIGGKFVLDETEKAKDDRLAGMLKNKLRTTWFSVVRGRLKEAVEEFDLDLASMDKQQKEFEALLMKEDALMNAIQQKRLKSLLQIPIEDRLLVAKEAQRDAAREFLAEKIRLVYGFDALLKEAARKLKKFTTVQESGYEDAK